MSNPLSNHSLSLFATPWILAGALGSMLVVAASPVFAQEAAGSSASPTVESLPIAVNIEGRKIRASMYLDVPVERYGAASVEALRAADLDPVEQSYLGLLEGVRSDDASKARRSLIGGEAEGATQRVELFRTAFGGFEAMRSIARLDLGEEQLFVWDWPSPRGLVRRGFVFDVASRRGELATSNEPLATLLVDIFQSQAEDPAAFEPVSDIDTRYAHRLPLGGAAEVYWRFDGEVVDFSLPSDAEPPAIPALVALHRAHARLAAGDVDAYLAAHTPTSRAKLAGWIEKMPPEEFAGFQATTLLPKRVRFVLDADPVHLVFYHYDLGDAAAQAPKLSWLYVYHDPASGEYLLANAYREAFLDDFLKDESLLPRQPDAFTERVLGEGR